MCLIKKNKFPRISYKPIKVYKVLEKYSRDWRTPYMFKRVKFDNGKLILKASESWFKTLFKRGVEGEGVHAYIYDVFPTYGSERSFKAVIPPFTFYWVGKGIDIASTKLIIYENDQRNLRWTR